MPGYLGIDPSLSATGVGVVQPGAPSRWFTIAPPKDIPAYASGFGRLRWFYDEFTGLLARVQPEAVAIEGYAFAAGRNGASRSHALGELGGVLRVALFDRNVKTLIVAPSTLKKFATGVGKGDKSAITLALYKRWGYEIPDNNEADGMALALLAQAHSDPAVAADLTKPQRDALKTPEVVRQKPSYRVRERSSSLQPVAKSA